MRQVFSSPRLENVEQVARLLEDAGIETRITDGWVGYDLKLSGACALLLTRELALTVHR